MGKRQYTANGKKKPLTLKDVQYALEFGHERLIKTFVYGQRDPVDYHLEPSGHKVGFKTANQILSATEIQPIEDGLLPGQSQTFVWQEEATHEQSNSRNESRRSQ